jgi:DNA-binding XRE family transcriptional regulator
VTAEDRQRATQQLLEHFPELASDVDDLHQLGVADARVQPLGGHWQPLVVFHANYEAGWCATWPWTLAARPTEDAARGAIIELLTGLAALRRQVGEHWPWSAEPRPAVGEGRSLVYDTLIEVHDQLHPARIERKTARATAAAPKELRPPERWGQQLRDARNAAGLKQRDLVDEFELNQNAMSLLERGQRNAVRPSVIRTIAERLGIDPPSGDELNTTHSE